MLEVKVNYPILHALCCCLGRRSREIFWFMLTHHDKLPLRVRDIRKGLGLSEDGCYRALKDLMVYNIIERTGWGEVNFAFKMRDKKSVSGFIRSGEKFDDMGCVIEEEEIQN